MAFAGGTGTSTDPYLISTVAQLIEINDDYGVSYYKLINNIDLVRDVAYTAAPIAEITGQLDGNGYKILNLWVSVSLRSGLINRINSTGVVKHLGLEGCVVSGGSYIGCLTGSNVGTILDCYSLGTVTGTAGINGGLVGNNAGIISRCYSGCSVTSPGSSIGGFVGRNANNGVITQCFSTGSVEGGAYTGGFVGDTGSSNCSISNCYSISSVLGTPYVGGFVGYNQDDIDNCYSAGSVSGTSVVGGFSGAEEYGVVSDCFWDTQTSGRATSASGTGKTTAEMKTLTTFTGAGWDFVDETTNGTDDIWYIDTGEYPKLSWQIEKSSAFYILIDGNWLNFFNKMNTTAEYTENGIYIKNDGWKQAQKV